MKKLLKALYRKYLIAPMRKANNRLQFDIRAEMLRGYTLGETPAAGTQPVEVLDKELIVSLTTYGKRLYDVYLAIESIMQNSLKPNRIVLWLEYSLRDKPLPITLQRQQQRGLEIGFTHDIKSYKKLIPTLQKYPDAYYITIDDDVIYDFDLIENLVRSYMARPGYVHANVVHRMALGKGGHPLPYRKWLRFGGYSTPHPHNFAIGFGAVLYPPGCFHKEVLNEEAFMRLAPKGDDIWFFAMARLIGTLTVKAESRYADDDCVLTNQSVQDIALFNTNINACANDEQIKAVFHKYGIYPLLSQPLP